MEIGIQRRGVAFDFMMVDILESYAGYLEAKGD